MTDTSIEWTDKTWNPATGCSKVSPGCAHCYAEGVADRFWGKQYPPVKMLAVGPHPRTGEIAEVPYERARKFTDVMTHADRLDQPLRWKKPARIFVNSMSDLFHEAVPDDFIDKVFAIMALARRHTFQVLTKRPERMRAYVSSRNGWGCGVWFAAEKLKPSPPPRHWYHAARTFGWPLSNVWLGVSVENQHFADERIPLLLQTPAAVRFISAEPLLGPVDLKRHLPKPLFYCARCGKEKARSWCEPCGTEDNTPTNEIIGLDWVIVGGESGPKARRCSAQWVRSVVRQCQRASVPVFVKQLGGNVIDRNDAGFDGCDEGSWPEKFDCDHVEHNINGYREEYQGADVRVHLSNRKGGDPAEWPEDLRVREFPGA